MEIERIDPLPFDIDPLTGRRFDDDAEKRGWTRNIKWMSREDFEAMYPIAAKPLGEDRIELWYRVG